MKTAIVTGATGFIGSHLCKELINNGIGVTGFVRDQNSNTSRLPKDMVTVHCGMDDYGDYTGKPADVFYHLAWEGATGPGRDDEELQAKNLSRTIAALKAAKRIGCKRFVALGTVYEKLVSQILADRIHRKADFYLLSKKSTHEMCLKLAEKLDIEFVWATIYQPIGKYIKRDQLMAYAVSGLLRGVPPEFGPACEPCDITAVEDVALGLRLLGECSLSKKEYYVGSGSPMLMKEYLKSAQEVLGVITEVDIGARPDDGLRFSFDWFDITPLIDDTGYIPRISYEKAVQNVADWIESGETI